MGFLGNLFASQQSKHAKLYMERGSWLLGSGSFCDAANYFDAAFYLDPKNTAALIGRGIAFEKLGYYFDAMESYSKAASLGNEQGTVNRKRLGSQHPNTPSEKAHKITLDAYSKNPYDIYRNYFYI